MIIFYFFQTENIFLLFHSNEIGC